MARDIKIDIEDLMVERVAVTSHFHSGPVNVTLEGVSLEQLLRAMGVDHDFIRQYLDARLCLEELVSKVRSES